MKEIKDLERRVKRLMDKEDIKTAEFRQAIVTSELGDVAKYITHDQELNPNARPHGTKEDEVLAYGQVFIQVVGLAYLRGVDMESALEIGLRNWEDADWRKAVAKGEGVQGMIACPGRAGGEAYVAHSKKIWKVFLK